MQSKIIETEQDINIITPKRKSWILIILFSIITLQLSVGTIAGVITNIFNISTDQEEFPLFMTPIFLTILFFVLRALLWQIKGRKEIKIDANQLIFSKKSPLYNKTRKFDTHKVKSFKIYDNSVSAGPIAMLQLIGIADKIVLTFGYNYETIETISGIDIIEAEELSSTLDSKLKVFSN